MIEEVLWTEKYRPRKIEDTILPEHLKKTFLSFVGSGFAPNLLLVGSAGVGKTTVAKAFLDELGADKLVINGSLEGRNIDTLRTDMQQFASSVSFRGGRKYIILDEADGITNVNQLAIRNFTELFSSNCGFIYTANFKNKIIEPIHSRCSVIDFSFSNEDFTKIGPLFLKRLCSILDNEKVEYDKKVLALLVRKHFPDFRRILNELQRYAKSGRIDSGIFSVSKEYSLEQLAKLLKEKKFSDVRKWVAENIDIRQEDLFHDLYKHADKFINEKQIPLLILTLSKYQYQAHFAADQEINLMACLTEIMCDIDFK